MPVSWMYLGVGHLDLYICSICDRGDMSRTVVGRDIWRDQKSLKAWRHCKWVIIFLCNSSSYFFSSGCTNGA